MKVPDSRRDAIWLAALLGLLVLAALARPLLPIDETRYASVAWEMWLRGDYLVPLLNGEPYHHKPPLLFWLIQAGWTVFGVNEWWPRLISPLFAAGTLFVTRRIAHLLWPTHPAVASMAPFILLASLLFAYFASALMFDAMISFFVALGLLGLVSAWRSGGASAGFALFAAGLTGALYSKGPVALLHLLPLALLAPWWMREHRPRWGRWYTRVLLALLASAAMILAWAVPAALAGGEQYRNAIFWGQTAGRLTDSFSHRAAWWYYLAYLPLILAPWLLWPRCWPGRRQGLMQESGFRFVLLGTLFCLVVLSAVSGKRWHYLLPEFALLALLAARALVDRAAGRWSLLMPALSIVALGAAAVLAVPELLIRFDGLEDVRALYWGGAAAMAAGVVLLALHPGSAPTEVRRVATAMVLSEVAILMALATALREPFDVRQLAGQLAQFQQEGRPVAVRGKYHGQWHLAGRLERPLLELSASAVPDWLVRHPQGRVVFSYDKPAELPDGARVLYTQRFRGEQIAILASP